MALGRSGEIRWASGGIGTSQHLAGELFRQMSGLAMVHVPYRGTGPALNDLAAGVVDAYFGDPATLSLINGGQARAMAVTAPERWPLLPATPAAAEAVPGYAAENWYGLAAPPGTPAPVLDLLSATVQKVMAEPATMARFDAAGLHPATLSIAAYRDFLRAGYRDLGPRRAGRQHPGGWRLNMLRLAVDIGGTFTDLVLEEGGRSWSTKLLTTPAAPEAAVLDGTRAHPGAGRARRRVTSAWSSTAPRWRPMR